MLEKQAQEAFRWNEIVATVAASALLAGMMACVGVTLGAFGARLAPGWEGSFLPWLCLFIALEALFSEGRVRLLAMLSSKRLVYRVSEIILLTLLLKLSLIFLRGENWLVALTSWQEDFLFNFFAGEFGGIWFVMMLVWGITSLFAEQVYTLVEDNELLRPGSEPQYFTSRRETRRKLAGQVIFLGAVMVVLTALTRLDLQAIWGALPPVEVGALNVLIYFFLALLLLSQGQFAVLRATWIWQQIPVTRPMAMGWLRYSLIFLGLVALLVLILPTRYSVSLLTLAQILFSFLFSIVLFLFYLISIPILWLLSLLTRDQAMEEPLENPFQNLLQPTPFPEDLTPIATVPLSELFQSVVFWGLFFLVCGYALVQYFRQNRELLERLRRIPGLRWFTEGMNAFLTWLRGATKTATEMAAATWARVRPQPRESTAPTPWNLIRPNRMTPRARVIFFYRAMLRRGEESGLPRDPAATPTEYATTLRRALPEEDPDIAIFTQAFQEARYTHHPIPEETASQVKAVWEHLRGLLKKRF